LGFPLEPSVEPLESFGSLAPRSDAYEALLDAFLPVFEARRSDAGAGLALLKRGLPKLDADRPYDAIRMLGRAELRLAQREQIEPFQDVLEGLSRAYRVVGLPWAARTKLLFAVDRAFARVHEDGDIDPGLIRALFDLAWVEIQLGR